MVKKIRCKKCKVLIGVSNPSNPLVHPKELKRINGIWYVGKEKMEQGSLIGQYCKECELKKLKKRVSDLEEEIEYKEGEWEARMNEKEEGE